MTQRRRASSHCGCRACPGNPFHHPHGPLRTALWTLGSSPRVTVERWQWTVRNRQTLRERLEGDEGEGVLDAGEGLNLLVHEVADVGAVPEVALDQQVVLPRCGVGSEERRVGKEGG